MQVQIGPCSIELVTGDITSQAVDAVVNAANSRLAGGGGVDGAIHRAGGPAIMEETRTRYPQGCPTGHAVITGAGALAARYVIHAVGPVWHGGGHHEEQQLAEAYRRSLEIAVEQECESVAFPALSTGAYGYPLDRAARTALQTVDRFIRQRNKPAVVRFVFFDRQAYDTFVAALKKL